MKLIIFFLFITKSWASENRLGLTLGTAKVEDKSVQTLSFDYQYLFDTVTLGSGILKIGPGLRYTRITSDNFPIYKKQEILKDISVNAFNLAAYTEYTYKALSVGFNIDFYGMSSGEDSKIDGSNDKTSPTSNNLLKGSAADKGTLNSELWIGYQLKHWILRAGTSHVVTEYEGRNPNNKKRQKFFDVLFVSAGWKF